MVATSVEELEQAFAVAPESPRDRGEIRLIVRRPEPLQREVVSSAKLCTQRGLVGDCWPTKSSKRTADGGPHPDMQLTLMNAHVIEAIAGDPSNWPAAGDQLYVDLDLSEAALPVGTRLNLGEAQIEITAEEHLGCRKFHDRYGSAALKWVNGKERRALRLRGVNARVIESGPIQTGDKLTRC